MQLAIALRHVTQRDQLSCVIGYAGAGKSTMMKTAKLAWQRSGYKVYGLAPTGRAAQNLEEIGLKSQTVHKFLRDYSHGRSQYHPKSVLILDEAGMVDVPLFNSFLQAADRLGVKVVVVGDPAQNLPFGKGNPLRAIIDVLGTGRATVKMNTVVRQQVEWQREATRLFGGYDTKEALRLYLDHGHVHFIDEKVPSLKKLVAKGRHEEVVQLYNLSRRVAGSLWQVIERETAQSSGKQAQYHQDFERFKHWQEIRQRVAHEMTSHIDTYRHLMKQQGVDPQSFASLFVSDDLSPQLRSQKIRELVNTWGLKTPEAHQRMHVCDPRQDTREALLTAWAKSQKQQPEKSHLILAYTNRDADLLNEDARAMRRKEGHVGIKEYAFDIQHDREDDFGRSMTDVKETRFSQGDRLIFTRNDKGLGVKNGSLGTIVEIGNRNIKVKMDGDDRVVSFAPKLMPYFDQGWAITIQKAQSATAALVFYLATSQEGRNETYVAKTRQQEEVQTFVSVLDSHSPEVYVDQHATSNEKVMALDCLPVKLARAAVKPPPSLIESVAILGNQLQAGKYYLKEEWANVCAKFTGRTRPEIEDPVRMFSPVLDEASRARLMMGQNVVLPSILSGPGSASLGGGSSGSSSTSAMASGDISAFLARQSQLDEARAIGSLQSRYKIHLESVPVAGTLAAHYLAHHLQVSQAVSSDIRFHGHVWHKASQDSYPAVVAFARNREGHIKALHQIYLSPEGQSLSQESRGSLEGAYVEIQRGVGVVSVVKEVEDALRLQAQGVGGSIYAALTEGNMAEVASFLEDPTRPVVLYGDTQDKCVLTGVETLEKQGFRTTHLPLSDILETQPTRGLDETQVGQKAALPVQVLPAVSGTSEAATQKAEVIDLSVQSLVLSLGRAIFTARDVERAVLRQINKDPSLRLILQDRVAQYRSRALSPSEQADAHLPKLIQVYRRHLLKDPEIKRLGKDPRGEVVYTSVSYIKEAQEIKASVERLNAKVVPSLKKRPLLAAIKACEAEGGYKYSSEQKGAMAFLTGSGSSIRVLNGRAGTGKTSVLKPVVRAYQEAGKVVIGTSFQGKVAHMLSHELKVPGMTLHQLRHKWQERQGIEEKIASGDLSPQDGAKLTALIQKYQLSKDHVVMVDEGNMVSGELYAPLLKEVERTGAVLVVVGDKNQIKTLTGQDIHGLIEKEAHNTYTLHDNYRQKVDWQREATTKLNNHQVTAGLQIYEDQGRIQYLASSFSAKYALVQGYLEDRSRHPDQSHIMLARLKEDVADLNMAARTQLKEQGVLTGEQTFTLRTGKTLILALGEQVRFTANDHDGRRVEGGVQNGTTGEVVSFDRDKIHIKLSNGERRLVDPKTYEGVTYNYANTINGAEGETTGHAHVLLKKGVTANQVLIELSRQGFDVTAYVDGRETPDLKAISTSVNKSDYRGLATDHGGPGHKLFKTYLEATEQAHEISDQIRAAKNFVDPTTGRPTPKSEIDKLYQEHNQLRQQAQGAAVKIVKDWDKYAATAHQLGIARDTLEVKAGLRKNPLTADQQKALIHVDAYYAQADQARTQAQEIKELGPHASPDVLEAYQQACRTRNAMAHEIVALPKLYQSLLKITQEDDHFITLSGQSYDRRPPGFEKIQAQAHTHLTDHLLERLEAAVSLKLRLEVGEKLLSQLSVLENTEGIRHKLAFEQRWARAHPLSTLEDLKLARGHYEAVSNAGLSTDGVIQVCHSLLGTPYLQTSEQLRYGEKGHLLVSLQEGTGGLWYDLGSGEQGTLLARIQQEKGISAEDAKFTITQALHQQLPQQAVSTPLNVLPPAPDLSAVSLVPQLGRAIFAEADIERAVLRQAKHESNTHHLLHYKVNASRKKAVSLQDLPALAQIYSKHLLKDPEIKRLGKNPRGEVVYTSLSYIKRQFWIRKLNLIAGLFVLKQ